MIEGQEVILMVLTTVLPKFDDPTKKYIIVAVRHLVETTNGSFMTPLETQDIFSETLYPFISAHHPKTNSPKAIKDLIKELKKVKLLSDVTKPKKDEKVMSQEQKQQNYDELLFDSGIDINSGDWGLDSLPKQYSYNKQVDSISNALTESKKLQKLKKQQDKELKKQELSEEKEEKLRLKAKKEDRAELKRNMLRIMRARKELKDVEARDILIQSFSMYVGNGDCLLEDCEIKINKGRKYGLLGRNGAGKTTLLRHISRGKIDRFSKTMTVQHLEQELEPSDETVLNCVLKSDLLREDLLSREKILVGKQKSSELSETDELALKKIYESLQEIDSDSATARASQILNGLGFDDKDFTTSFNDLSGGWRMRVNLAKALFNAPDLLLLDEPTNHLDLEAVIWLERYLISYSKTLVIVSHDRNFMNSIISDVILLDNKKLEYFKGDIDVFERTRAEQNLQKKREYESTQQKIDHMNLFINKFRANAKRASLVQSRIKAVSKLERTQGDKVEEESLFSFSFPPPSSIIKKTLIKVSEVSFGYEPDKLLFEDVDFSVDYNSRVALLGPNGCGKSTLIALLLDNLSATSGSVTREPKVKLAHFAQHHLESMDPRKTAFDFVLQVTRKKRGKSRGAEDEDFVRKHLARYGVTQTLCERKISKMSGGQKSRVAFALCTLSEPHILVLDEPTNHLDLETVQALIDAVRAFEGGIIYVSHDQHFIEQTATTLLVFNGKKVVRFKDEFKEYKKQALKAVKA